MNKHLLKNINCDLSYNVDKSLRNCVSTKVYNNLCIEIFNKTVMNGDGAGFSDIATQTFNAQRAIVTYDLVPILFKSCALTSLKSL